MKIWEKIALILTFGTIWGVAELFGWDILRALDVSNKSTYLFLAAFFILIAAKRVIPFFGSMFLMSLVTIAYKSAGVKFFGCQAVAVAIDALAVDTVYYLLTEKRFESWKWRSIGALLISVPAFAAFGFFREFIWAAPGYESSVLSGVLVYMLNSALTAVILSIVVIHPAYTLGNSIAKRRESPASRSSLNWAFTAGVAITVILWAVLFLY